MSIQINGENIREALRAAISLLDGAAGCPDLLCATHEAVEWQRRLAALRDVAAPALEGDEITITCPRCGESCPRCG